MAWSKPTAVPDIYKPRVENLVGLPKKVSGALDPVLQKRNGLTGPEPRQEYWEDAVAAGEQAYYENSVIAVLREIEEILKK